MVGGSKEVGHFRLTREKTALVYAAHFVTQARLTIALKITIASA
jgi:hypothetical protein